MAYQPSLTYDSPPLVEVAMSVQFKPPHGLNLAHLGAFWFTLRHEFPHVRAIPPIAAAGDDFGAERQWMPPALQLEFSHEPDCRLQMASGDDQWMYQVQRDRVVVNWRKRGDEYPRFSAAWERFQQAWRSWCEFLGGLALEAAVPGQWELTYVNRIPQGELWSEPADWPQVFPALWASAPDLDGRVKLAGGHGQWFWRHAGVPARLLVESKPARAGSPPVDLLMLVLTARGPIDWSAGSGSARSTDTGCDDGIGPIGIGMNLGHELVVGTFDEITSEFAQQKWKRREDS